MNLKKGTIRTLITIEDENNPEFLFSQTRNVLLIQIIKGEINPVESAKKELANRGYDLNNEWVGFDKTKELFNLK